MLSMEQGQPLSRQGDSLKNWVVDIRVRHPGQLFSGDATSDRIAGQEGTRVFCRLQEKGVGLWWPRPREKGEGTKRTWVFSSPLVARWNLPDSNSQRPTRSARGGGTKVEEKSPVGPCEDGVACWKVKQTARWTGSRWKLRIELTPSPVRASVYRTLVGFFGRLFWRPVGGGRGLWGVGVGVGGL